MLCLPFYYGSKFLMISFLRTSKRPAAEPDHAGGIVSLSPLEHFLDLANETLRSNMLFYAV